MPASARWTLHSPAQSRSPFPTLPRHPEDIRPRRARRRRVDARMPPLDRGSSTPLPPAARGLASRCPVRAAEFHPEPPTRKDPAGRPSATRRASASLSRLASAWRADASGCAAVPQGRPRAPNAGRNEAPPAWREALAPKEVGPRPPVRLGGGRGRGGHPIGRGRAGGRLFGGLGQGRRCIGVRFRTPEPLHRIPPVHGAHLARRFSFPRPWRTRRECP